MNVETSTRREVLESFLSENGCQEAEEVIENLKPLFQIADSGRYALMSGDLNQEEVREAIAEAICKPNNKVADDRYNVHKVVFASIPSNTEKFDWMVEGTSRRNFGRDIWNSLGTSFEWCINSSNGDRLGFEFEFGRTFQSVFWENLGHPLRESYDNGIGYIFPEVITVDGRFSLGRIASYYVGFKLAGKHEDARRIKPLMELLPQCFPIGHKKDEPGTIIILVA